MTSETSRINGFRAFSITFVISAGSGSPRSRIKRQRSFRLCFSFWLKSRKKSQARKFLLLPEHVISGHQFPETCFIITYYSRLVYWISAESLCWFLSVFSSRRRQLLNFNCRIPLNPGAAFIKHICMIDLELWIKWSVSFHPHHPPRALNNYEMCAPCSRPYSVTESEYYPLKFRDRHPYALLLSDICFQDSRIAGCQHSHR